MQLTENTEVFLLKQLPSYGLRRARAEDEKEGHMHDSCVTQFSMLRSHSSIMPSFSFYDETREQLLKVPFQSQGDGKEVTASHSSRC